MKIVKMSGAGNDFVMLGPEERRALGPDLVSWTRRVCRRGLSVGADGVLIVEPVGEERVRVRFYNPDGAEAFCGNGSRCAARFARLRGWVRGDEMLLETAAGTLQARLIDTAVRLILDAPTDRGAVTVEIEGERVDGRWIVAGVPHFVVRVEDVSAVPLPLWGPRLRRHERFGSEGTNVDLAAALSDGSFAVRTWERGVEGETLACGTGAIATALAARLQGAGETVTVLPASGVPLRVTLPGASDNPARAVLEGDARVVFEGTLSPEGVEGFPA